MVATVEGSELHLTCPSFLSVFLTSAVYGRTMGEDGLCDGSTDT